MSKKSINTFYEKKGSTPITVLTAYDYFTAKLISKTDLDCILVGDSLGMVFQGNDSTLPVTVEEMLYHVKTVKKGAPDMFIIADMPFLSYHISVEESIRNCGMMIKEGGANAIKLEGGEEVIDKVKAIIAAKIPVMGHLGLTPQSVNAFGGFKVQGKDYEKAHRILQDALLLEKNGVFSIVLECVPEKLAKLITSRLKISTIGIGAGRYTDGQVLVINDIFSFDSEKKSKFVKLFSDVPKEMEKGIAGYIKEVTDKSFPDTSHTFSIDDEIITELEKEFK